MKNSLPIADCRLPVGSGEVAERCSPIENRESKIENAGGFSLIEILVVITLLSLIVVALMAVFNSTQTAFRSSVTQTDVLEGGQRDDGRDDGGLAPDDAVAWLQQPTCGRTCPKSNDYAAGEFLRQHQCV